MMIVYIQIVTQNVEISKVAIIIEEFYLCRFLSKVKALVMQFFPSVLHFEEGNKEKEAELKRRIISTRKILLMLLDYNFDIYDQILSY